MPGTRGDRGAIIAEFALVLPVLAILVFGTVDLGRAAALKNRLTSAAREAGAVVQFFPTNVDTGCDDGRNAVDGAMAEDTDLATMGGFSVIVEREDPGTGTWTVYTGCGTATPAMTISSGDNVRVTVTSDFDVLTPLVGAWAGDPISVSQRAEVVVQG